MFDKQTKPNIKETHPNPLKIKTINKQTKPKPNHKQNHWKSVWDHSYGHWAQEWSQTLSL